SDLGVNPGNDGNVIRVALPQLTEERRKEMVKITRSKGEEARVSIRNIRRHAKEALDKLVKDGEAGEDDGRRAEKELDELTAKHVATVPPGEHEHRRGARDERRDGQLPADGRESPAQLPDRGGHRGADDDREARRHVQRSDDERREEHPDADRGGQVAAGAGRRRRRDRRGRVLRQRRHAAVTEVAAAHGGEDRVVVACFRPRLH
ncbi:MAG: ribosome recycling factor, partial [Frankiaceae bacterium]|nr:ribosome recycling factor [Frankiaceae bacterium]